VDDLATLDATAQAELVRAKEVTPRELGREPEPDELEPATRAYW
jgi:hypothetical protein